nr:photosystem I subunit I [Galeola lindleyana]
MVQKKKIVYPFVSTPEVWEVEEPEGLLLPLDAGHCVGISEYDDFPECFRHFRFDPLLHLNLLLRPERIFSCYHLNGIALQNRSTKTDLESLQFHPFSKRNER